jgi:hypothetical protein
MQDARLCGTSDVDDAKGQGSSSSSSSSSGADHVAEPAQSSTGSSSSAAATATDGDDQLRAVIADVQLQHSHIPALQRGAAWPRELLAAAAVQRQDADQTANAAAKEAIVERYLTHESNMLHFVIDDEEDGGNLPPQQQQDSPAAAAAAGLVHITDVAELALQPPLPLDAFVAPSLWWERQQELHGLDSSCDGCGKLLAGQEVCIRSLLLGSSLAVLLAHSIVSRCGFRQVC